MLAETAAPPETFGRSKPRIAPPVPAVSRLDEYREISTGIGIGLFPWQETAARYLMAANSDGRWTYPEVAIIVGRQNGKTELLKPLIVQRLLAGEKVMHTAQNAKLPRDIHEGVATLLQEHYPSMLPARRSVSYAVGHEEIRLKNGGLYRIVAPTRGGARGPANDLVIVDELREMVSHEFIAAAEPTLSASPNPQIVFLSNAGTDDSDVLNKIRKRGEEGDPALAYLEWSASPGRDDDDVEGWLEANPSIGYLPGKMDYLVRKHRSYKMAGELGIFETEHLCRWVPSLRERLVPDADWAACEGPTETQQRGYIGIAVSPEGTRASGVLAWRNDERVEIRLLFDVTDDPIDIGQLGSLVRAQAEELRVRQVGFDPLTDGELAKYFDRPDRKRTKAISGQQFANASSTFANIVKGKQLRWSESAPVTADLMWTAKKEHDETGSYQAVRAKDDRPITASLAAIRAVWLASGPQPVKPRVY